MSNDADKNQESSSDKTWQDVKTNPGSDDQQKTLLQKLYVGLRQWSIFSRRKKGSIVDRVLWLLMMWGLIIYVIAVAGIWWGSTNIIEDNFSNQAVEWVRKLDELGTPLYASEDERIFKSIEDHVIRFPELSYLRYYEAEKNEIIAEYKSEAFKEKSIPYLTDENFINLKKRTNLNRPLFISTADTTLSLIQASAPIVIRSVQSDGFMELDLDADQKKAEEYKIIGYIELGLDFGIYRQQLLKNIVLGSVIIALLFFIASFIGRSMIKDALSPLVNLRKPLKKLADGDIDVHVKSEGDEEVDAIAKALNTTIAALKNRDKKLQQLANYDALTGLLNKHNFHLQLKQELDRVIKENDSSALLFIDLDQFKYINDSLGHAAGDHLLAQIAELLKNRMRKEDVLSRFGGDEFTVIVKSVSAKDAELIADSVVKSMQDFVFVENDKAFNVYCSIGVVMIDSKDFTVEDIFSQADMACFQAKSKGRNRYHMYDAIEQEQIRKAADVSWSSRIKDALENDLFSLKYQRIVSLGEFEHEFYEVLLQMQLQDGEIVESKAFLPAADRLGYSEEIGVCVIKNAFKKIEESFDQGRQITLLINITNRFFEIPDFVNRIKMLFGKYKIDPASVIFQITEQAAIKQIDRTRQRIAELITLGCRFSLDNFGVGFSSFGYLKNLPVSFLKIDGSYISTMSKEPVDQAMVQSMINISKTLDKQTIAEYVQDKETLEMLKAFGCDYAQGYFLGKPSSKLEQITYEQAISGKASNVIKLEK